MQNLPDKELFEKIQSGDDKALELLFARYYNALCNFSLKITRDAESAEEVVADIFYNLWKKARQITIEKSIKAYLFTSVKHKSFELLRQKKLQFEQIESADEQYGLAVYHPESSLLYNELVSEYQKAYEALPKQCQLIFKLNKLDGLKYKEISDLLNLSIKTVENQMGKALKIIRKQLQQYQLEKH